MKKLWIAIIVALLLTVTFATCAFAATLACDTVKEELNIYINVPGNHSLGYGYISDYFQNTMVIDVFVRDHKDKVPEWQPLKLISGEALDLIRWDDTNNPRKDYYYRWELGSLPKAEGDSVYEVSCVWNGETLTKQITIHCKKIELPDGLGLANIESTVYSDVGETLEFNPSITPEGWQVPGYPQRRLGFDGAADEFADCNSFEDGERKKLTFTKSGTFETMYMITTDNISVVRHMTFVIGDQNGKDTGNEQNSDVPGKNGKDTRNGTTNNQQDSQNQNFKGKTGLQFDADGAWRYYRNGEIQTGFTGLYCDPDFGWWLIRNGVIDFGYTGLWNDPVYGWWLIGGGQICSNYNGLWNDPVYGWWLINGGTIAWKYNGLWNDPNYGWWLIAGGQICWDYTGLWNDPTYGWWLIDHGALASYYTGLWNDPQYGWWLIVGGHLANDYNGLWNDPNLGWWLINGGSINFGYTGPHDEFGATWNIVNGQLVF